VKTKRLVYFLLVLPILLVIFLLVRSQSKVNEQLDDKKIVIGFCIDTMIVERWQRDKELLLSMANEKNIDVITLNANEDNDRQVEQIKQLIDAKVDAIIVIPYNKDGLTKILQKAHNKGIIIISYDRLIKNSPIDAYISFDNEMSGRMMADSLVKQVPIGNYIIINGSSKDNNSYMLNTGYKKVLDPEISIGNIKVIDEVWAEDWREDIAYETVIKNLDKGKQVDGIIASNDRLAEAAIKALSEYGLAGSVGIVGQDSDIFACQQIVKEVQTATIYKPIKELVAEALDVLVDLINGKVKSDYSYIDNGYQQVKYYHIEPTLVDKNNMMQTIIQEGFHNEEDVYKD